jgi:hypothetical protein
VNKNVRRSRSGRKHVIRRSDLAVEYGKARILSPLEASHAYIRMMRHGLEDLPTFWTPEYVGLRLIEAYETLGRTPRVRGPAPLRALGSPRDYSYTADDREEHEHATAPAVVLPTLEQINRMDQAFDWLSEYLGHGEGRTQLQAWAHQRSKGKQIRSWSEPAYRAAQTIASGLQANQARMN